MRFDEATKYLLDFQRSQGLAVGTLRHYKQVFGRFERFLAFKGYRSELEQISHFQIREFWVYIREQGLALGGYVRDLRRLWNFLIREGLIASENVVHRAGIPRTQDRFVKPLPDDVLLRLRSAAKAGNNPLRDTALVSLLIDTGARIGEILSISLSDIDLASRRIPVRGKGSRDRGIYFGSTSAGDLKAYLNRERRSREGVSNLFVTDRGLPLSYGTAKCVLVRLARRAKLSKDLHVSAHKFRHSFSTGWLARGGSDLALQKMLGHSTLEMVSRYAKLADKTLQEAHEKYSPADSILGEHIPPLPHSPEAL